MDLSIELRIHDKTMSTFPQLSICDRRCWLGERTVDKNQFVLGIQGHFHCPFPGRIIVTIKESGDQNGTRMISGMKEIW